MAGQSLSSASQTSVTPTSKSKGSQDDSSVKGWLRHKRWRRTVTLLCVVFAAGAVLHWYGQLVIGPKPEPTRAELMPFSATGTNPGTIQPSSPTPPTGQTAAQSTVAISSNVSGKESGRVIATSSWEHVVHTTILLGSCVAIFAILAWAAVALNREDD
jgi:hypothetical protein